MPKFINVPTNYTHLEGTIDGVKKNIYLFMDMHYDLKIKLDVNHLIVLIYHTIYIQK